MSGSDLTGENLYRDPYPVYARLRQEPQIAFFEGTKEYLVTRFEDCRTVGSNDRVFGPSGSPDRPEARVMGMPNVLTMTGGPHLELRTGIEENLTADRVRDYVQELTRPVVDQFLDDLAPRGSANLTADLFEPVSVRCIGNVIGLTDTSNETLVEWFHAMGAALQNVDDDPAVWDRLDAALADIDTAMRHLYDRAAARPDHTLMSHVMHGGTPDGSVRPFEEVLPTMKVIILGGLQEPGHAAANACTGLLLNPDQAAAVAADPAQHALRSFDEGLRWISPIGVTPRVATEDVTVGQTHIAAGSSVTIVMASANRDPERFERPDEFDMLRKKKPHLSFGFRPHFCSGHALSRAMGEIALQQVFERLPHLRLDQDQEVQAKGWRFRGVSHLPAAWDA